uniref:C-X-C chemokine receptor type 6 n=1 Tax=Salvator merianae TaxID=96440 RepID=A0A8D0BUB5_SALMN
MSTENPEYLEYIETLSNEDHKHEALSAFCRIFLVSMYSFACIIGVSGNTLVLIIFIFYEKVKVPTDVFLVSLAIADLCFLCTLPFWAYSAADEWIFSTLACKTIRGLYMLNLYGSMLTLTVVTIDRYFVVVQATKAYLSQARRTVCVKLVCISVWLISLAVSLPQFLFSSQTQLDKKVCQADYSSDSLELFTEVIQMALGYFCPMLVMIICYSIIVKTLLSAKGFHKYKSLKIIFAVVATFIFMQTPYNLLKFIRVIHKRVILDDRFLYALIITEAIAYFHSCLNPVLYFFIGAKFRKNLAKILKKFGWAKHQQNTKQWQTTEDDSKTFSATRNPEITSMHTL